MAEVLLNPDTSTTNNTNSSSSASSSSSSGHPNSTRSNKKRLNWLNWMRKSLDRSNRSKLCSCGFFHHNNDHGHESTTTTTHSDWPVFTMSQSATHGPTGVETDGLEANNKACILSSSNRSNSDGPAAPGSFLPLRPIHLASRCHEEVLYTRLNRSCSMNSEASMTTTNNTHPTTTPEPVDSTHPSFDEKAEDEAIKQIEDDRIVVNLESIEVVPNLDETRLLADANESSSTTSSSSSSLSSKSLSIFSSPFKRKPKGIRRGKSKEETFQRLLLAEDEAATVTTSGISTTSGTTGSSSTAISREELLRLFILKLDEEANYFQVSASPEEELCDCQKCQIYYCEYYGKYLEEYERRRMMNPQNPDEALVESSINSVTPLEASILMDDIMNNGMTFCSIM